MPKKSIQHSIVYVDGSSRGNPGPAGIGIAIFTPDDLTSPYAEIKRFIGFATNNVAEYEAVIQALVWLKKNYCASCTIKLDSELVYKQIMGQYRVRKAHMAQQLKRIHRLLEKFDKIKFELVPRSQNKTADRLAQSASKKHKTKKKKFEQPPLIE